MSVSNKKSIRIANASGYWGDDPHALKRQVMGGPLDYITMDFLAEITMSIMQKQRSKDPNLGYAKDFIPMMAEVFREVMQRKIKIITNAGGVNPMACGKAIMELAKSMGLKPNIAIVEGDDIMQSIDQLTQRGAKLANMENGDDFASIRNRLQAANVYFGARPVVAALQKNADIVITGRVTDTGITLAPMIYEFGWDWQDWDKLAAGIVGGHIIECGSQSTGGNFTDWHLVPSFDRIGYPIIEVQADGSLFVTKHENTGGLISVDTVREQLVYEMGDPIAYITPDVVADFTSIRLEQAGHNRVLVSGVRGKQPTNFYKVSMAYSDGLKSLGSIIVSGPAAREKAEKFAEIFWRKCDGKFDHKETEYFGWNACHRSLTQAEDGQEILLRLGVRGQDKNSITAFGKLISSLILGGPPGCAVIGGAPKPQEIVSYWPALIEKELVQPVIHDVEQTYKETITECARGTFTLESSADQKASKATTNIEQYLKRMQQAENRYPLSTICLARSGDKGDTANIGLIARSPAAYDYIKQTVTAQLVKDLFQELCHGEVVRYQVPNLLGLNFLLEESLGGGGTMTLRADAQGKTFAQALLRQEFPIPVNVLQSVKKV